jgi:transposase
MARLSAEVVEVTEEQRETLEAIVRKRTNAQQLVMRAKIILCAGQGKGVRPTARELGVSRDVVQCWRRRWQALSEIASVEARLADAPRPGAPGKFSAEDICAIVALSCELPETSGRPITDWTQQELADEVMTQGIVPSISQRSVGRFLKRSRSQAASHPRLAQHEKRRGLRSQQPGRL